MNVQRLSGLISPIVRLLRLTELAAFAAVVRSLSRLVPKDESLVAFMPHGGEHNIDNVAHLYEWLRIHDKLPRKSYVLLSRDGKKPSSSKWGDARNFSPQSPREALRYFRTSLIVSDSYHWTTKKGYDFFSGAKKVQIWHGIPLKKIELSNLGAKKFRGLRGVFERGVHLLRGRHPTYDLVVSTSDFFKKEAFEKSFRSKRFVNAGYPRNDYLFLTDDQTEAVHVDKDAKALALLAGAKSTGKRVVLYAPTFRDTGGGPGNDPALNLETLRDFAGGNDLIIVVKLHPYATDLLGGRHSPHLVSYEPTKDPAPLLRVADLLVTDYSSVFFDYLLLDRPIVFFPYDREKYFEVDRGFLFDYDDFTPGPKCHDQASLQETIARELSSPSPNWAEARARLKEKAFEFRDGSACDRIWRELEA